MAVEKSGCSIQCLNYTLNCVKNGIRKPVKGDRSSQNVINITRKFFCYCGRLGQAMAVPCPDKKRNHKLCTPVKHATFSILLIALAMIAIGGTFLALHFRGAGPDRVLRNRWDYRPDFNRNNYAAEELLSFYYNGHFWYDFVDVSDVLRWQDYVTLGCNAAVVLCAGLSIIAGLTRRRAAVYMLGTVIIMAAIALLVAGRIFKHNYYNTYPVQGVREIVSQLQDNWILASTYDQKAKDSLEYWQLNMCCCGLRGYSDFAGPGYVPDMCACVNNTLSNSGYPTYRCRAQHNTCNTASGTLYNTKGCLYGIINDYKDTFQNINSRQSVAMMAVGGIQIFLALMSVLTAPYALKKKVPLASHIFVESMEDCKVNPALKSDYDFRISRNDRNKLIVF